MERNSKFSNILSKALDTLGYSFQSIIKRVRHFNDNNENTKLPGCRNVDTSSFLAGSKREGISLTFESDSDIMHVMSGMISSDNDATNQLNNYNITLNRDDTPPGYTKLKVEHGTELLNEFEKCTVFDPVNKAYFFSSKLFMKKSVQMNIKLGILEYESLSNSGPSAPIRTTCTIRPDFFRDTDHVIALSCNCSDHIDEFCSRERLHGYPSHELLNQLSRMKGHVVPVGHKSSNDQDLQWRICYTQVEIMLIQSFNATQYHLYVILKMLAKTVLKPVCADITSYVIKNLVLWIIEITPMGEFQTENLSKLIFRAILFLKMLVNDGYIPNYMIPARNLLSGKISLWTKMELVRSMSSLLDREDTIVLECPEIKKEMIVLLNNPVLYGSRLEERNSFNDSLMTTGIQMDFESVRAFTDVFLHFCPVLPIQKITQELQKLPGYLKNVAIIMTKPLVLEAAQQYKGPPEDLDTIRERFRSDIPEVKNCISKLFKEIDKCLETHPDLLQFIIAAEDANMTPDDVLFNVQPHILVV